ncbi:MAG TPA: response regulator, partial [Desulfomonilia bacterium]|nr:response regulator [Desulfomonilia bacterium]
MKPFDNANPPLVFVVNDAQAQLVYLSGLLTKQGLDVKAFTSAEAALAEMKSGNPPHLIVTDLHMPGLDGWRLCRLLRSPEYMAFNAAPILVVSATFSGEDPEQITADLGANAFLPAPVDSKHFIEHVKRLLAGEAPQRITRALIIDSNKSMISLISKAFMIHGYEVHTANRGHDAIRLFSDINPEIVILDYHIPDADDGQLIKEFNKINPSCAVVVITSDPKPELALKAMKLGARAYARKPFDPQYLIRLCENARRELSLLHAEALLEERTCELRESEQRYRTILDSIDEAYFELDLKGNYTFFNDFLRRAYGYSSKELMGMNYKSYTTPEDAEKAYKIFNEIYLTGKPKSQVNYEIIRKDGTGSMIEISVSLMRDPSGEPIGFRGVGRDVSERIKA